MDSRTLTAFGLAILLGISLAAAIAYFRYNSARRKYRRSRAADKERGKTLRAEREQAAASEEQ